MTVLGASGGYIDVFAGFLSVEGYDVVSSMTELES